jgi:hypothetical protein
MNTILIFFQGLPKEDLRKNLIIAEEALACDNCQQLNWSKKMSNLNDRHQPSLNTNYLMITTKKKLLLLLLVASLALLSIVIISEQLIQRHLGRHFNDISAEEPHFTILTLESWAPEPPPQISSKSEGILVSLNGLKIVENGLFWAEELEAKIAPGPSDMQVQVQIQELRERTVQSVDNPDWLHCGREKNRFVHFQDGGHACARFRSAHTEFVQGEVMAFYLARLLGISNTPAVVLSQVRTHNLTKL